MNYIIFWTKTAKKELNSIINHYLEIENYQIAKNILIKITKSVSLLGEQPKLGKIEIIKDNSYRSIISNNYKIYYNLKDDKIIILTIFDFRRNPLDLKINNN